MRMALRLSRYLEKGLVPGGGVAHRLYCLLDQQLACGCYVNLQASSSVPVASSAPKERQGVGGRMRAIRGSLEARTCL